jgi:hypothetical protein
MFAACGGAGSGVESDKRLVDLSANEQADECAYVDAEFPAKTITCQDGTRDVGGGTVSDCVAGLQHQDAITPSCGATVADYEGCLAAIYDEPDAKLCTVVLPYPSACDRMLQPDCLPPKTPTVEDSGLRFPRGLRLRVGR